MWLHAVEQLTNLATGAAVVEKMYDVRGKRCQAKNCIRQPGFGDPVSQRDSKVATVQYTCIHSSTARIFRNTHDLRDHAAYVRDPGTDRLILQPSKTCLNLFSFFVQELRHSGVCCIVLLRSVRRFPLLVAFTYPRYSTYAGL